MATKINSANNAETFEFTWDEELYPTAFAAKVKELVNSGMTEQEAREELCKYPNVTMEVVYSTDRGLFFVESDAIESTTIYDPYTAEECEVEEE